jgi:hypothetical protein
MRHARARGQVIDTEPRLPLGVTRDSDRIVFRGTGTSPFLIVHDGMRGWKQVRVALLEQFVLASPAGPTDACAHPTLARRRL